MVGFFFERKSGFRHLLRTSTLAVRIAAVVGSVCGIIVATVMVLSYTHSDEPLIPVLALITMLIYAAPLHSRSMPWFARPMALHRYCILAFLTVLMTYFGVNFLLGGMHSYA